MSEQEQSVIGPAVQGIAVLERLQPRNRRGKSLSQIIKAANAEFALGDHFLHLQEFLSCLRNHFWVVGILRDHFAIFLFGPHCMGEVAVGLLHLLIMDVGDFDRRFCGLRHIGEEGPEVFVFLLGLCKRGGASLGVPGIGQRQFGARDELRVRIGIDQRLHLKPGHVETVMLHRVHAAVKQNFVWLLGVNLGQRIVNFLVGAGGGDRQRRGQSNHGRSERKHEYLRLLVSRARFQGSNVSRFPMSPRNFENLETLKPGITPSAA